MVIIIILLIAISFVLGYMAGSISSLLKKRGIVIIYDDERILKQILHKLNDKNLDSN